MKQRRLFSVLKSCIDYPDTTHFSLDNIPFGVGKLPKSRAEVVCTRIGDKVVNLTSLEHDGLLSIHTSNRRLFHKKSLNKLMQADWEVRRLVRERLQNMFDVGQDAKGELLAPHILESSEVKMMLPAHTRDVTHFVASGISQSNLGNLLKADRTNPLPETYCDIPLGHNGRASNLSTDAKVRRPLGFYRTNESKFRPSRMLDYSLGLGFYIGGCVKSKGVVTPDIAMNRIFGYVLMNAWQAHDMEFFELCPTGPLNSKNFATSVSPWVVTPEALKPFEVKLPAPNVKPSVHLELQQRTVYDIALNIKVKPHDSTTEETTSSANMKDLYWSPQQLILHQMMSGVHLNPGDLIGTGTISAKHSNGQGSLLEKTINGSKPWTIEGVKRFYLENNDTVIMRGRASNDQLIIGFGELKVQIGPSLVKRTPSE
jgi:fumarylacetoacetase